MLYFPPPQERSAWHQASGVGWGKRAEMAYAAALERRDDADGDVTDEP
jgi:hypothetical protein